MRAFLVAVLGGLALAGCAPTQAPASEAGGQSSFPREMSVADRAACTAAGGRIERRGRLGAELCVKPFADAGKACTDTSQCQGMCVSRGTDTAATAGQCQTDNRLFGCYSQIKGGKAVNTICVD
jgi:putative hemolysin